jgi:hypothetical protein
MVGSELSPCNRSAEMQGMEAGGAREHILEGVKGVMLEKPHPVLVRTRR